MRFALALMSCLLLMCSIGVAHADKRVALVIGNGAYQHTPALINPKNDADDIGKTLRGLGFATIVATDLDRAGMSKALDRFSRTVSGANIAIVYYSGHGMQFAGKNYLLPVDAQLQSADDVNRFRLLPLSDIFGVLQHAPGARIVILDACRNNPVEDDLKRRVASIRGGNRDAFLTRGLSRVEANGLIVAYATQANDVAADGTGNNSPFAKALLDNLATPNIDVRQMLFNVQDEVDRLTDGKQRPELSISLVGKFKLKVTASARENTATARDNKETKTTKENKEVVKIPPLDPAAQAWAVTRDTTSQAVLKDFIRQFGKTVYGSMARARLKELKKTQVAAVPPPAHAPSASPNVPKDKLGPKASAHYDVAALTSDQTQPSATLNSTDLVHLMKLHLRQAGCDPGDDSGVWDKGARRALGQFNKHAGTHLDVNIPSMDSLKALQAKQGRVCPLVCRSGTRLEGDHCVAVKPKSNTKPSAAGRRYGIGMTLRYRCHSKDFTACATLCNAGFSGACRRMNRLR